MVQQGQIDHLLQEAGEIPPPPHVVEQATMADYDGVYARSVADPEGFWAEAAEELHWFRRWDDVFQWDYPNFRWFVGGQTNIAYNALDRHLTTERRNKAALIWLGEDGTEQVYTYARLAQQVNRFANGLKSLGVGKGDRVVIYMPLTPEGAISMLACARIGAIHSVVYAGFSVGSLRDRIQDADAKALITGDVGYRRGNRVDLKGIADEAVEGCDSLEHVIVFRRELALEDLRDGETDFDGLMARSSIDCPAEVMDAEDPLYILYTSGTTGKPKGVVHVHGGYMVGTHYHFKNFWDVKDNDVFWCMSDIGWVVGHSYIVYAPLVAGATTVFREGAPDFPHNAVFYEVIEKYGVNVIFTAPTAVRMLMRYGEEPASRYNLRSLRFLTCAGEPLNPEALRWAYEHICGSGEWAHMVDNWWQTETGGPCLGTTATMTSRPGTGGQASARRRHGHRGPGGPAHRGTGQGRVPGHSPSLPPLLPHRVGRPGPLRRHLEPDTRACIPPATWPCATPTATTWWWAAPTTCSTWPATASAPPRWSRRWCRIRRWPRRRLSASPTSCAARSSRASSPSAWAARAPTA